MKIRTLFFALIASLMAPTAFAQFADVGTVVDESGSMAGEHAWLPGMIGALQTGLTGAGVGTGADANQYSVTGFGDCSHSGGLTYPSGPCGFNQVPHTHTNAAGDTWFEAGDFASVASQLTTIGGWEDGWTSIQYALNTTGQRAGAATNLILVTDEDRDAIPGSTATYANTLAALANANALLNAVVNASFRCADGSRALGIDSAGTGYVADGSGGFTTCEGATAIGGSGSTVADYVNLALATGGAAWDLNLLRAGGLTATSFTNAFVAIKVKEIQQQQEVAEPGTLALLGLGLLGLGISRRRRTQ